MNDELIIVLSALGVIVLVGYAFHFFTAHYIKPKLEKSLGHEVTMKRAYIASLFWWFIVYVEYKVLDSIFGKKKRR